MTRRSSLLLAGLALLAGCVPSLHPLYTAKDLIFEPQLLGTWRGENEDETWAFSAHDPSSYRLVVTDDDDRESRLVVHLVNISDERFLDIYPEKLDTGLGDLFKMHYVPAHTFFHVEQIEPTLRLAYLDPDWLETFLAANPTTVNHELVDDLIVLTAPTDALQAFVLQHLDTNGAFSEPSDMHRVDQNRVRGAGQ
ncbi:MAG: hypothetical protein OEM62_00475 [Acidobacteriota bacterium]|nr:hypothetical protein [Acidobacteriota bacterium]